MKQHHVVPNPNKGWDVKTPHCHRASAHAKTKSEAILIAREISRNQGSELVIHNQNGQIYSKDSHGKDPIPPRG